MLVYDTFLTKAVDIIFISFVSCFVDNYTNLLLILDKVIVIYITETAQLL